MKIKCFKRSFFMFRILREVLNKDEKNPIGDAYLLASGLPVSNYTHALGHA